MNNQIDRGGLISPVAEQQSEEQAVLHGCIAGDAEALACLRNRYQSLLVNALIARGANRTEAEDIIADLWGDCVGGSDERRSLLEKFSGKCALQSWLITVAINRFIDRKRRQLHQTDVAGWDSEGETEGFFEHLPSAPIRTGENGLIELLRDSLQSAFAACPAEGLLMLRLVYQHGLSQREVARMWNCHESKISRALSQAMSGIQKHTLQEIRKMDRWLDLTWQDLLDFCETQQLGFLEPLSVS
jgi:RNA polymerase sigma factor (sigma-70 family)